MKKRVMLKWVKALRSGDYLQGSKRLVSVQASGDEKFCCLGVLCDLATQDGFGEWDGKRFRDETNGVEALMPPDGVMAWAGITPPEDSYHFVNIEDLAAKNDGGANFLELANLIEANYQTL